MTSLVARHYRSGTAVRIHCDGDRIAAVDPLEMPADELQSLPFVAPGLFDIQVNGYHGLWFCSAALTVAETIRIVEALVQCGIARCFPTLITCSFDAMLHGLQTICQAAEESLLVRDVVRGFHLEGPYISPEDGPRGAHPRQHVRPADFDEFQRWQQAAHGSIRLVTIAPEAHGSLEFIRRAVQSGVRVSLGHTGAAGPLITAAVDAGATLSTHLGNGCASLLPRHDNVLWPQLADDRLTASVIADGWHLPQPVLQSFLKCKTLERLLLTCDVSGFGGCPPGVYDSGNVQVEVLDDGRIVVAGQRQYLAGSGATTGDCVAQLIDTCGLPLADAWDLAAEKPAALFAEPLCRLHAGQQATLTVFHLPEQPAADRAAGAGPGNGPQPIRHTFQPVATLVRGRLAGGQLPQ